MLFYGIQRNTSFFANFTKLYVNFLTSFWKIDDNIKKLLTQWVVYRTSLKIYLNTLEIYLWYNRIINVSRNLFENQDKI